MTLQEKLASLKSETITSGKDGVFRLAPLDKAGTLTAFQSLDKNGKLSAEITSVLTGERKGLTIKSSTLANAAAALGFISKGDVKHFCGDKHGEPSALNDSNHYKDAEKRHGLKFAAFTCENKAEQAELVKLGFIGFKTAKTFPCERLILVEKVVL